MRNDPEWINHVPRKAPIFSPEQYREILTNMPINNPTGLRARVALIFTIDCDMRDSDLKNVMSCNVVNVPGTKEIRPLFRATLPFAKNDPLGRRRSFNDVMCTCANYEFDFQFTEDPMCPYHAITKYCDRLPERHSTKLCFMRGITRVRDFNRKSVSWFKRSNCGIGTLYEMPTYWNKWLANMIDNPTGNSARRTGITLKFNAGASMRAIQTSSHHKSTSSLIEYHDPDEHFRHIPMAAMEKIRNNSEKASAKVRKQ